MVIKDLKSESGGTGDRHWRTEEQNEIDQESNSLNETGEAIPSQRDPLLHIGKKRQVV